MKSGFCILLFSFVSFVALCQDSAADSVWYSTTAATSDACYRRAAGASQLFYNGAQYSSYIPKTKGHPYFITDSLTSSSILYNGILYPDVKMKFDLVQSKPVLYNFDNGFLFCPGPEKIKYFIIGGHYFENMSFLALEENTAPPVFFENIFSGSNVSIYLQWEKNLFQPVKAEDTMPFYKEYKTWYILKAGVLYEVNGKRSVLKILGDRKQELKNFMAVNHIEAMNSDGLKLVAVMYEALKK